MQRIRTTKAFHDQQAKLYQLERIVGRTIVVPFKVYDHLDYNGDEVYKEVEEILLVVKLLTFVTEDTARYLVVSEQGLVYEQTLEARHYRVL